MNKESIHEHMCIRTHTHACVHICVYMSMHTLYIRVYVYTCINMCLCVCTCDGLVCMCVWGMFVMAGTVHIAR